MPKKTKAQIFHFDSFGKRQEKYDRLNNTNFADVDWKELPLKEPYYFFVPKDFEAKIKYDEGFSVSEIFKVNTPGIVTSRDKFIIDFDEEKLKNRIKDFINLSKENLVEKYGIKDTRDFKIDLAKNNILSIESNKFIKINYRPFDFRNIYYEKELIDWGREKIMNHMLKENIGLGFVRQVAEGTGFNHALVSKSIIEYRTVFSYQGGSFFAPLYLYQQNPLEQTEEKIPNFNGEVIEKIEKKLKIKLDEDFSPEDLFDYIYGVLHSKTYRETYKEFLKIDFPKIPFDVTTETFFKMRDLGRELRSYHLMENENLIPKNFVTKYPVDGDNIVEKVRYTDEKVFINDAQYFEGVPMEVWEFYIGGYQPCSKWLKDRKSRELSYEDILHYSKIILSLKETIRIMEEIEEVLEI